MRTFVIVFASLLIAGCSSEPPASPGPTYAEAVATYQAEVALLDSLQSQLEAADAKYRDEIAACSARFERVREECDEMDIYIRRGFRDQANAKTHLEENNAHLQLARDVYSQESKNASNEFSGVSAPLKAEIESQKTRVENAKVARDQLSQ